jgi:hypothetical protein
MGAGSVFGFSAVVQLRKPKAKVKVATLQTALVRQMAVGAVLPGRMFPIRLSAKVSDHQW